MGIQVAGSIPLSRMIGVVGFTAPASNLFLDTFTGVAGTNLPVHTPDVNPAAGTWANIIGHVGSGTPDFQLDGSGSMFDNSPADLWHQAIINSGEADGTFEYAFTLTANSSPGVVFRAVNATAGINNSWFLIVFGGAFTLYDKIAGVLTQRATTAVSLTNGTIYWFRVVLSGTSITCYLTNSSGTVLYTLNYTSSAHQTATYIAAGQYTTAATATPYHRVEQTA